MRPRQVHVNRTTEVAEVVVRLNLDGEGAGAMQTGFPFLDHMLTIFARHSGFDLEVQCRACESDPDGPAQEIAACLGLAFAKTLEDSKGMMRSGHAYAPVDEHLARTVVEISGHPRLVYRVAAPPPHLGATEAGLVERFWHAFVVPARINLHIELLYGREGLPACEAVFKATGRALREACRDLL